MIGITNYILEKLKITKDTKINKNDNNIKLTPDIDEYNGIKFIEKYKDTKDDFKRYGSIPINLAYEIIQIIIDNCKEELQGYYFALFYSGYSGFIVLNSNFNGNIQDTDKYKEGIICFYPYADKTGYKVSFTQTSSSNAAFKLKEFIGQEKDRFKI